MSELKDWICYRDPNGVGFTHSWLSIGGGPYCCTRCGRQMPVETASIPCPSWPVPQIPGPDYPALVTRLAQALGSLVGIIDRLGPVDTEAMREARAVLTEVEAAQKGERT